MGCAEPNRYVFISVCIAIEIAFLVLFAVFADYEHDAIATHQHRVNETSPDHSQNSVKTFYAMFQDVHVMIFIGFGFLMTFLKKYGFSAVGINMLLAAITLQWAMLIHGWLHMHGSKFEIGTFNLLASDFAAAAVLISFGAVIGKTSPFQLLIMVIIEVVLQQVNEWVGLHFLGAVDCGESMYVHVFGAYFGLAVSRVLYTDKFEAAKKQGESTIYHSEVFAMIGTIFLWLFWPSFNAGAASGDGQIRAVINTYLSLAAGTVVAFAVSMLVTHERKFWMVHIQNSTLAGGVAVGTVANMAIGPYGAIAVGISAGTLSVLGYTYLTPRLERNLKLFDTCGVNNLHGMPGVLAGIAGVIGAAVASFDNYGYTLYSVFPFRTPADNSTELFQLKQDVPDLALEHGVGRSASIQACYQLACLVMTFCVAIVGGVLTGFLLKLSIFDPINNDLEHMYNDSNFWETPEDINHYDKPYHDSKEARHGDDTALEPMLTHVA